MATFESDDRSVVEFQLGNKQLFLLFLGLLVICAIFFFIGLRVGEDTAKGKVSINLANNAQPNNESGEMANEQAATNRRNTRSNTPAVKSPDAMSNKKAANEELLKNAKTQRRSEVPAKNKSNQQQNSSIKTPAVTTQKSSTSTSTSSKAPAGNFPATVAGKYYVQIAAQTDMKDAKKLLDSLPAKTGKTIQQAKVNGTNFFRVLMGPFNSKSAAEKARQSILAKHSKAFVKPMK